MEKTRVIKGEPGYSWFTDTSATMSEARVNHAVCVTAVFLLISTGCSVWTPQKTHLVTIWLGAAATFYLITSVGYICCHFDYIWESASWKDQYISEFLPDDLDYEEDMEWLAKQKHDPRALLPGLHSIAVSDLTNIILGITMIGWVLGDLLLPNAHHLQLLWAILWITSSLMYTVAWKSFTMYWWHAGDAICVANALRMVAGFLFLIAATAEHHNGAHVVRLLGAIAFLVCAIFQEIGWFSGTLEENNIKETPSLYSKTYGAYYGTQDGCTTPTHASGPKARRRGHELVQIMVVA